MQMHIDNREIKVTIDSLECAITIVTNALANEQVLDIDTATRSVEQLQMLRLALMLGAAKEQREGRANTACTCDSTLVTDTSDHQSHCERRSH